MIAAADVPTPPAGVLIGGRLHEPAARIDSDDPSSGRPWTEIPWCAPADVELAVAAARAAFDDGAWARGAQRRAQALRAIAATIRAHAGELAEIESRDNGKPLWATRVELANVPRYYDWFAGAAELLHGSFLQLDAGYNVTVRREPLGVVGALIAWNSPLLLCAMKLAPALACGNTVVVKPADSASASVLRLGELLRDVEQLPAGVVNVVTGGAEVGQALVAHPGVDCVSFTGGDVTAEAVLAAAAPALKPVKVEAGGKAAHIVFDDADLDAALTAAVAGAFISGGQSCASGARVLVHEPIWERFAEAFVARAQALRLGHPRRPGTHVGPMATDAHRRRVERYVEQGVAEGARCRLGAELPADPELRGGYWVRPAVMLDATPEMTIAQDEIFGPVPVLMRFADEQEALAIANSTRYGLASGLWTRDIARAERIVDAIDAGTLWVNCYRVLHWAVPFGGWRRSGLGRENGLEALHEYTQAKSVMTATRAVASDPFELAGAA